MVNNENTPFLVGVIGQDAKYILNAIKLKQFNVSKLWIDVCKPQEFEYRERNGQVVFLLVSEFYLPDLRQAVELVMNHKNSRLVVFPLSYAVEQQLNSFDACIVWSMEKLSMQEQIQMIEQGIETCIAVASGKHSCSDFSDLLYVLGNARRIQYISILEQCTKPFCTDLLSNSLLEAYAKNTTAFILKYNIASIIHKKREFVS